MSFSEATLTLAARLVDRLARAGLTSATAESCTGGLIAAAITEVAGASAVFMGGFITYDNRLKRDMLGVEEATLRAHGAVSPEVARAMAEGACRNAGVDVAVAATGIAGPGGGSAGKPVGLVHLAAARAGRHTLHERHVFTGDRSAVRAAAVAAALSLMLRCLDETA